MKKIMYIAAALLVLVGCQKSQEAKENAPANYGTITGKIELPQGPNKISAPEGWTTKSEAFTMVWDAGDQIYIYNGSECKQLSNPTIVNGVATFEGDLLSDMSEYKVAYGYDPQATATDFSVEYIDGNYHPFAAGTGTDYTFSIANFEPVIGLQLKGTDALTKIEVVLSDKDNKTLATYTMTFENALQLNESTASNVYFPIQSNREASKLAISFYKNESSADVLIMTKTTTNIPEAGKATTFPVLTVAEPFVPTYVDLGLPSGVKWATCNVGATKPEEYGDYFAWGETAPHPNNNYSWGSYKYCSNGDWTGMTKYTYPDNQENTNWYSWGSFIGDNKRTLDLADDAAAANWKGNWRMPTAEEFQELMDNCNHSWTTRNGVKGRLFTSKTNSDNYIFLPAAGFFDGTSPTYAGSGGYYWSSSLGTKGSPGGRYIGIYAATMGNNFRYYGQSVRPVCTVVE